ncbi:MAG: glycoside hydrolase family 31 protein [Polyangiaceae bacterium]
MRRSLTAAFVLVPLALAGCGGGESQPSGTVDVGVSGGFDVTIVDGARVVVASSDKRVLLDGLPSGDVAADGPPLVGFALRDVDIEYEMQFGAFKPTETASGPWRVASSVTAGKDGSAAVLDLADSAGKKLATIHLSTPEDHHLVYEIAAAEGVGKRFSMGFKCDAEDHFAGFGSQTADVDHRGFTVPAFVQEQGVGKADNDEYVGPWFIQGRRHSSHIPIPEYLSRRGYMLAADTNLEAWFALCSESETAARVEVQLPVKLHVFDGPTPHEAIERATATLGRPRMPPKVAFAPWNDAIFGSDHVRAVAQKLRDRKIPTSVIWTEDWKGGAWDGDAYRLSEEWQVDTTLYPDFPKLADDLHALGFHFHVYFNPFIYKDSSAWEETSSKGLLVKNVDGTPYVFQGAKFTESGLIDLDSDAGRAWVVGKMRDAMAQGADGWMNDFAEWLPTDSVTAKGSGMDRHNLYPVKWQEAAREAIDGAPDGKERLFFGRSGWLGTPALADVIWAGDQRTNMAADDGFPTVVPIGIGLGVTGVSTYGHDIGGYQSGTNAVTNQETFFRWTALAAWSPVMRTHHGTNPNDPSQDPPKNPDMWTWDKDEETILHFKKYADLHMSLVPFFEGLAKVAHDTGLPIWRGLFMAYPEDAATWPLVDEVMVGDGILVAPVMTAGAKGRSVYLPAGQWYSWDAGGAVAGGATIDIGADLGQIPVYARAGTVVPAFPDGVMTLVNGSPEVPDESSVKDDRVVYVFPGQAGSFTEAGGLSYTLEQTASFAETTTFVIGGTTLPACADPVVAPCVESGSDRDTVHAVGPTELTIDGAAGGKATVKIAGGAADRKLTIVVRR